MQQHVHAALASQEWEWLCYGIYLGGHDVLCHVPDGKQVPPSMPGDTVCWQDGKELSKQVSQY